MKLSQNEFKKFDLSEATQQIIATVNALINKDISQFGPKQNIDFDLL